MSALNDKISPTDNDNPRAGVASYTAGIFQEDCVYINYISRTGDGRFHGGVFRTDDLYFYATYPGSHFMLRSKLINSSMGRVTKPAFYGDKTTVLGASLYTQSSAACTAGTTTTLTAASAAWTVNAYQGRNLQYKVATVNYQARIVSNTATVLTLINYADDTSALSVAPVAGQEYEIREASGEHWTMSSVILDPQKMWSQYDRVVQNLPFFTSGLGGVYNADLDRWATNHQLMGVGAASTHNDQDSAGYLPIYPFDVRRLDAGGSELGRYYVPFGSTSINDPRTNRPSDPALTNFRHWSAVSGGKYTMAYPGRTAPASYMHHTITDGWRSTDNFVLRLPFTGATAQGWISSQDDTNGLTSAPTGAVLSDGRAILLVSVATQALVESATVPSFWLDTAGGFVWVKYFGGRTAPAGGFLTGAFNNILKRHFLTIRT